MRPPTPTELADGGFSIVKPRTFGDAVINQAGKASAGTILSSPKPSEQTHTIDTLPPRGNYDDNNPYPTNPFSGEQGRIIRRNKRFGELSQFSKEQGALYLTNPVNANIVNPLVITAQLPGEGIVPTTFDAVWRDDIQTIAKRVDNNATLGARVRANVGQIEGTSFSAQFPPSVGQVTDLVVNKIEGFLGIKKTSDDFVNPKSQTLRERLKGYNRLDPDNPLMESGNLSRNGYMNLTQPGFGGESLRADKEPSEKWRTVLGGVDKSDLAKSAKSIDGEPGLSDFALGQRLEEGWLSNVAIKSELSETNSAADNTEPVVLSNTSEYVFPFYFESLNHFTQTPERFITFQATFSNLREEFRPTWNTKRYFGRTTGIYIYEFTDRSISFDFIIHAQRRDQLGVLRQRINWLARHVYPSYLQLNSDNTAKIIFEAPIIKFTIGDLFRGTPGIIKALTYDWDMGGANKWEISKGMIIPQAVKATIQIDVLHNKFMENSALALSDNVESSDFYEFIKTRDNGLIPSVENTEKTLTDFTEGEADAFAGETVYG